MLCIFNVFDGVGGWRKLYFMGPLQLQASLARVAKRKRGRGGQLTDRSYRSADVPGLKLDALDGPLGAGERSGLEPLPPVPHAQSLPSEQNIDVESVVSAVAALPARAAGGFFVTRAGLHPQPQPQAQSMPVDVPPELIDGLRPNPPSREISDIPAATAHHSARADNDPEAAAKTERIMRWLEGTQNAAN